MGAIEIVPYQERWPDEFRELAAELRRALQGLALRIDHVGSTSVPGLAAKDVLDVQVAVGSLDAEALVRALHPSGLVQVPEIGGDHVPAGSPDAGESWRKLFFRAPPSRRRVHVHVRVAGAANARYALLFRDFLRGHRPAALAYAELKRRLAALGPPVDAATYADVKDPVCDLVMVAAEDWAARVGWEPGPSDG